MRMQINTPTSETETVPQSAPSSTSPASSSPCAPSSTQVPVKPYYNYRLEQARKKMEYKMARKEEKLKYKKQKMETKTQHFTTRQGLRQSASAPVAPNAPVGVAPVGVAPVGVAPVGVAPVGVAPVGVAPVSRAPASPSASVAPTERAGAAPLAAAYPRYKAAKLMAKMEKKGMKHRMKMEKQAVKANYKLHKYSAFLPAGASPDAAPAPVASPDSSLPDTDAEMREFTELVPGPAAAPAARQESAAGVLMAPKYARKYVKLAYKDMRYHQKQHLKLAHKASFVSASASAFPASASTSASASATSPAHRAAFLERKRDFHAEQLRKRQEQLRRMRTDRRHSCAFF